VLGGVDEGGFDGDLFGFDLEDAELRLGRSVFAQGAFGEAGTGLARGDELAGELDDVGLDGRGFEDVVLKLRCQAEGDLLVELGHGVRDRVAMLGDGVGEGGSERRGGNVGEELDF
jgi:hypothetical protein